MMKKIKTKTALEKRIELGDTVQDKTTNQKNSWSQKRENNEETYSEEFTNFIFKI
jgi:hypothetical protein